MRGLELQNSMKTAIGAYWWPFRMDKNCDALPSQLEVSPATPEHSEFHRFFKSAL
jgi:hypothetical protein